jgi:DNA-binding response OmpR family regulator
MPTILVVEDSPTQSAQICGLLSAADFQVCAAPDGLAALSAMARQVPDLVLTDLNMPQMNGLDLVLAVRREYPQVPVVLMTAFGSEEIAVRALQVGAASYVPKRNLHRDLINTLRDVLDVAQTSREDARLAQFLTSATACFALSSVAPPIMAVVGYVQNGMTQLHLGDETDRVRVGVALDTAVHNLLQHGNLELTSAEVDEAYQRQDAGQSYSRLLDQRLQHASYGQRQIHVNISMTPHEVRSVVRHEGPGFDARQMFDSSDNRELDGDHVRGWLLVNTFMDELTFNPTGTEATMVRRFCV